MHTKSLQSCPTLCDPMDCSLPGSSVHGILQARILEWVACPPPGDLPDPGIEPMSPASPALGNGLFTISVTWEAPNMHQPRTNGKKGAAAPRNKMCKMRAGHLQGSG